MRRKAEEKVYREENIKKNLSTKEMTLIGLMTAVICILGPLSLPLPLSPVPITFTNLALYFALYVLGTRKAVISCMIYLLLGMAGLPVFSGFSGGFGKLAGPTGGYLIGYIFMTWLAGVFIDKAGNRKISEFAGMAAGTGVCYLFGTVWLCYQTQMGFYAGFMAGVIPYIAGDLVKIVAAISIGSTVRKAVRKNI